MDDAKNTSLELQLKPSLVTVILLVLVCLAVISVGVAMIISGAFQGWFVLFPFLLGLPVAPMHYRTARLILKSEGFQVRTLRRADFFRWDEVQDFGVLKVGLNSMVVFNFSEKYDRQKNMRALSVRLVGSEGALPDTYGMKARELAELMARYQQSFRAKSVR